MPDNARSEEERQSQSRAGASNAAATESQGQQPGADASAVGNAGVQGRSQRSDALPPAPDAALAAQGPAAPSTGAAVNAALVAAPFSAATLLTTVDQFLRNQPTEAANLSRDVWLNKAAAKLNGDQMYQLLVSLRLPAVGSGRTLEWMKRVAQAHVAVGPASATTYTNIIAGAAPADLAQILLPGNDVVLGNVFAMVNLDPLTLFPSMQAGLTAEAAGSARFVSMMLTRSTDAQIWRAVKGTPAPALPALAGNINAVGTGWDWVGRLVAASLVRACRAVLNALHPSANATGQQKITAANAVAGVETPGVPFATAFDALKASAVAPTPANLRAFLQTGSAADRAALMQDATKAAWVFGILTGHPLLELSVEPANRGDFLAATPFFTRFANTAMGWREFLTAVSDRSYISRLAANLQANGASLAAWVTNTLPAKDALTVPDETDLRAVGLTAGHAGLSTAIATKFADTNYDGSETQSAAPSPASAHDGPLTRLDAALAQPVPTQAEVLSMVGALATGPDRATLLADAARLTRIRNALGDEQFYDALVALRMPLGAALTQIRQKGQSAQRVQSLIGGASALDRNLAIRDDANIGMVRALLPDNPLQLFVGGNLDPATLSYAAWRGWVLDATPVSVLLPQLGGDGARATNAARALDAADAWGFLGRVPSGPALSGPEKDALNQLLTATGKPAAASAIRSRVTATTEPAAPAPAPPPPPGGVGGPDGGGGGAGGADAGPLPGGVPDEPPPPPEQAAEAAPAPTPRQQLETEVQSPTPSATRVSQLAGELSQPDRDAVATAHRARFVAILNAVELARFVNSLTGTLAQKLGWLREKGGTPNNSEIQALIARAPVPERVALFDDRDLITLIARSNTAGPFQTVPGIQGQLGVLANKPFFWWWLARAGTPIDVLKYVAMSTMIPTALAHLTSMGFPTPFANLPRGTGLTPEARGHLDDIMAALTTQLQLARDIFAIRFNAALSGAWAAANIDDIRRLYLECKDVPIAHVANNPKLQVYNRGTGGGGTYEEGPARINIDEDDPNSNDTMYNGPGQTPVTERYFDHTVRHEIGHSVDAMLGSRTSLVFNQAGWKEYGTSQLDQWIQTFDGWNPGGGAVPTDPEKQQIRDLIMQLLHSGGGAIAGPGGQIGDIAPADHPWKRFPKLSIVDAVTTQAGTMTYTDRHTAGGKIFSINYYYRRFMECGGNAGANIPRDYAMFSPAEWFADMYAEYYRNFNGTDDSTLGGQCPGWVKSWFLSNVHTVGGRTPQALAGRSLPPGQRAHH